MVYIFMVYIFLKKIVQQVLPMCPTVLERSSACSEEAQRS